MIIVFLFFQLLIGQILKTFSMATGIPYTSLLCVVGILIGHYRSVLGPIKEGVEAWTTIGPHELLLIFMPPLIFESAFNSDWHIMRKLIW